MKNQTFLNHSDLGYNGREGHRQKNSNLSDEVVRSKKIRSYALVRRSGWCQYSRSCGWYVNRLFLIGKDADSGWFSIQVPATINTVEEAIEWTKPAAVKKAEKEKRQVVRQGDIYFFQTARKPKNGLISADPESHKIRETAVGYEVYHYPKGEHDALKLRGFNWKSAQRKAITARGD